MLKTKKRSNANWEMRKRDIEGMKIKRDRGNKVKEYR